MTFISTRASARAVLAFSSTSLALAAALLGGPAAADSTSASNASPANPDAAAPDYGARVKELVVTAPAGGGAVTAGPVQAPIQSTEPTSIVTRQAIDLFVPQTGDFAQVIALTPSMAGISQNGPGFYEAKSTLRGFSDGQYNITYDGIPFGDTNDFTHHSTSFFPASNLGAISVERGPGQAGQLGEATFGGSVNTFSPEVSDERGGSVQGTYGSWNTGQLITKFNTGDIPALHGTRILIALQQATTDGYLTNSGAYGFNEMARSVTPLWGNWTLTLFTSVNYTHVDQDDNNGATRQQVALFGKNFALTKNQFFNFPTQAALNAALNPKTGAVLAGQPAWPGTFLFQRFNTVSKHTDFEYGRLAGDLTATTHFDNTGYTYYYDNQTLSAQDTTGAAAIATHIDPTNQAALTIGHVPGYTKLNHYRVYGNILRLDQDLPFGQLRAGVWLEHADTHRSRLNYDITAGIATGNLTGVPDFHDPIKAQVPAMTAPANILYDQHSTFDTVQPFVDLELNVTPQLTVTPGLKYVDFWRKAAGPFNQGARNAVPQSDHQAKLLYFATANYRIQPNWSVYAQFATGFLQAPLSVLQSNNANTTALKPQQTTNYQLGTVFHDRRLTVDADLYYITFDNLLSSFTNASSFTGAVCPVNETCFENVPGATYSGVEGQATAAITDELFGFVNGSYNNARNNRTHVQIAGAPKYTFAAGAIFRSGPFESALVDKLVGDNPQVDAGCTANTGPCVRTNLFAYNFYRLGPYNQLDLTGVFHFGRFRLEAAAYNLLNSQLPFKITPASKKVASAADATIPFDQQYFQPPINFQVSLRYNF